MRKFMLSIVVLLTFVMATACTNNGNDQSGAANGQPPATTATETTTAESAPTAEPTLDPTETAAQPEPTGSGLTAGVYFATFEAEGRGEYYNFIHFYDSGVFYASLYNGGQYTAGFYEVLDEPMEYNAGDDVSPDMKNADKTIVMNKMDGSEYMRVAYDEASDILGDISALYFFEFVHDLTPNNPKAEENGVTLQEYRLGDDDYSVLAIKHNGTFQDTISVLMEGKWTLDGNVYTLVDGDSGSSYTMVLSDDGDTAEYAGLDGVKETLSLVKAAEIVLTFAGSTEEAAHGVMEVNIICDDSGAALMKVSYAGTERAMDGSWALDSSYAFVSLTINGTDYTAPINPEDHSFTFDITLPDGVGEVTFAMSTAE